MRILGLVVIASACATPAPVTTVVAQPDCSAVVAATGRFVADQRPSEGERIKSVVALRCIEDHWPAAAITCISAAASTEAAHVCVREHLTVAQNERLMTELAADGEVNREPIAKPDPLPEPMPDVTNVAPPPAAPGSQASIAAKVNDDGQALFARGNFAAASSKFREAVARVPEAKYFLNLCLSLYKEGKFGEAQAACHGGTKSDPDRATAAKLKTTMDEVMREAKAQHIDLIE